MMRALHYTITFFFSIFFIMGCKDYEDDRVIFSNTIDPYVAFSQEDVVIVFEDDTASHLYVYLPVSIGDDVNINYSIQNITANENDYAIPDFSNGTGISTIEYDPQYTETDYSSIIITPIDDTIQENDDELFVIEINSALAANKDIELDVGTTGEQETYNVYIKDDDCSSSLEGTYETYLLNSDLDTINKKEIEIIKFDTNWYEIYDITAGYFNDYSPPNVPIYTTAKYYCGYLRINDMIGKFEYFDIIDISGEETTDTTFTISWTWVYDEEISLDFKTYFDKK